MHGRVCAGLLALLLLVVLAPNFAAGQSDRASPAQDAANSTSLPPAVPTLKPNPPESRPPNLRTRWPVYSAPFGLPQISHAAGMIFSGTVTAIARSPARGSSSQSVKTVLITFHVDQAIRGATPGQDLTITQWMGAWSSGQRYRVGERVLLFLYPPSKLGLTSCVGGTMGHFALDPMGRVLLSPQHLSAFRTDPILGGKSRVLVSDFANAVRRASEGESAR
jgi:hypothetical protein